jgi:hypothetical protein
MFRKHIIWLSAISLATLREFHDITQSPHVDSTTLLPNRTQLPLSKFICPFTTILQFYPIQHFTQLYRGNNRPRHISNISICHWIFSKDNLVQFLSHNVLLTVNHVWTGLHVGIFCCGPWLKSTISWVFDKVLFNLYVKNSFYCYITTDIRTLSLILYSRLPVPHTSKNRPQVSQQRRSFRGTRPFT